MKLLNVRVKPVPVSYTDATVYQIAKHAFLTEGRLVTPTELDEVDTAYRNMLRSPDHTFALRMEQPTTIRVNELRRLIDETLRWEIEERVLIPFRINDEMPSEVIDDETFERIYYHLFGAPPNTTKVGRVEYMRGLYGAYLEDRSWDLREYVEQAPLEDANAVRTLLNGRVEMRGKKPL